MNTRESNVCLRERERKILILSFYVSCFPTGSIKILRSCYLTNEFFLLFNFLPKVYIFQHKTRRNEIMLYQIVCLFSLYAVSLAADTGPVASLSRDGYARPDPNDLLGGFFPGWYILVLACAGTFSHSISNLLPNYSSLSHLFYFTGLFAVVGIMGFILHAMGCHVKKDKPT